MRSEGTEGTDLTRFRPLLMVSFHELGSRDDTAHRQEGKRIALELIESLNGQLPQEL